MDKKQQVYRGSSNYRNLIIYKKARLIGILNNYFVKTYINNRSRTTDQMDQAARSGKQNITEGLNDLETSFDTGIHLVNVAKGSLLELLCDYEDYLVFNDLEQWPKDDERTRAMRRLGASDKSAKYFLDLMKERTAETCANMMIVLLYQADYLAFRFLQALGEQFEKEGGFKERLYRIRSECRNKRGKNLYFKSPLQRGG